MSDTRAKDFKARIAASKKHTDNEVPDWDINVDYRRGKFFESASDKDRIAVNIDAPFTKAKQATLFSQVPQVVVTPKHETYAAAAPVFAKALNEALSKARVGVAMDECLPDMINMAGFAGVIVSYEAITEPTQVPAMDPAMMPPMLQQAVMNGTFQIPMLDAVRTLDSRIVISHIEPEDILRPLEFRGSDFNDAPWIGRVGRLPTWEAAKRAFPALKDEDKEKVLGDEHRVGDTTDDVEHKAEADRNIVVFDEIYYWRHLYHEDETSFSAIQRMVFVNGVDEPVVDEKWNGQRYDEQTGAYLGSCLPPVQLCTLTHISGEAVPPSDSAISRPQVDELSKSRTQMMLQRQHSQPLRWADTNRVDLEDLQKMQRGEWQNIIQTNGEGSRAIGEVARANYPQEDFMFNTVNLSDLKNQWGLGDNQLGNFASGERSASEAAIIQSNNQTRVGAERAKVADFFLRIAQITAGLITLYAEWDNEIELGATLGPDGLQKMQAWDRNRVNHEFAFTIRPDSAVLMDTNARIQQILQAINYLAKRPGANTDPLIAEWLTLINIDPTGILGPPPQPPPQDPPSLSLKGEDLANPVALAALIRAGVAPTPKDLAAALELLGAAKGMMPTDAGGAAPLAPMPPVDLTKEDKLPTSDGIPQGEANPSWQMSSRLNTRRSEQV